MSKEEKQAIAYLKFYIERDVMYENKHYEQIKILLNLIEKQQKEIEELKKPKFIMNFETGTITQIDNNFIAKDKIREKIKELEKEKTEVIHELDFKSFYTLSQLKDIEISVLNELLEE